MASWSEIQEALNKPADASDISNLQEAQAEMKKLQALLQHVEVRRHERPCEALPAKIPQLL